LVSSVGVIRRAAIAAIAGVPDGTVTLLDAARGVVLRSVRVGRLPLGIAVDEQTHRAFVANVGDDTVSVLDTRTGALLRTVQVGEHPWPIAVDVRQNTVVVGSLGPTDAALVPTGNGSVSLLDAGTGALLATAATGIYPSAAAVNAQAGRAFIANAGSNTVTVLDTHRGRVLQTITLGPHPATAAVSPSAGHLFVGLLGRTSGLLNPIGTGTVDMLDARTGRVVRSLNLDTHPGPVVVDDRSRRAFVLNSMEGTVSVLDAATGSRLGDIPLGPYWPASARANVGLGLVLDSTTGHAFVSTASGTAVWMLATHT
jgi:YVTN family beta-propeller protein